MNNAYELAALLEYVAAAPGDAHLMHRWAAVFECSQESGDLALALATLQKRFELLQAQIQSSALGDRAKSLYLGAINRVLHAVKPTQAAARQVAWLHDQEGKNAIDLLHLAGESLPREARPEVNELTLEALVNDIAELIVDIQTTDAIDLLLKDSVLAQLSTILVSIKAYKSLGASGASQMFGAAVSELARISRTPEASEGPSKKVVEKAVSFAKKTGAVVMWASSLVSNTDKLLTDGGHLMGLLDPADHASTSAPHEKPGG